MQVLPVAFQKAGIMLTDQMAVETYIGHDEAMQAMEVLETGHGEAKFGDYIVCKQTTYPGYLDYVLVKTHTGDVLGCIHTRSANHTTKNIKLRRKRLWRTLAHLALSGFSEKSGMPHAAYGRCVRIEDNLE